MGGLVRDFHFEFPSGRHCTPSCLVSRQSGAVSHATCGPAPTAPSFSVCELVTFASAPIPDEPIGQKVGQGRVCVSKTKAFSFTHRTKVIADGTVRKNNARPQED